jgi:hypothetical protein
VDELTWTACSQRLSACRLTRRESYKEQRAMSNERGLPLSSRKMIMEEELRVEARLLGSRDDGLGNY